MHSSSPKGRATRVVASQALAILVSGFLIALGVNALRAEGIPVVATVPYDIFSPCRDSEETAETITTPALGNLATSSQVVVVDARPSELFHRAHVLGAVSLPFSVLFGATDADIARLRMQLKVKPGATVLVYGAAAGVELAGPLAAQLKEKGITNVKQIEGGLEAMQQGGFQLEGGTR